MPAEFVKCVDALLKEGKPKDSAYAICTKQYMDRHHGNTPQHDEKKMHASLSFMYEEIEAARKKKVIDMTQMRQMMKEKMKGY